MSHGGARRIAAAAMAAMTLAGCIQPMPKTLLRRDELVARYNANARQAPRLWARAKIHVSLRDDKGWPIPWGSTSPLASPNGLLLLNKDRPGSADFVLVGLEAGRQLFRLGSGTRDSDEQDVYYLWYQWGQRGQAYWGLRWLAGAEGVEALPLDPLHLLGVLGIVELPGDFTQLPTVAVTMQEQRPYAYVLTYLDRQPLTGDVMFRRRLYLRWSDTQPARPFRMDLLDNAGRTVMIAYMSDYQPIDVPDLPAAQKPPVMPTDLDIRWPQRRSRIHIVLSEMTTRPKWEPAALTYRPPAGLPQEQVDLPLLLDLLEKQGTQP